MENEYQEILENLMHELARINSIIKSSAEIISKGVQKGLDKPGLIHHSEIIIENSFLLSTHLDVVNYQLNPNFFELESPTQRSIYGKFHKAILSCRKQAKQRNNSLNINGTAHRLIDSYPVIDALPILLIDNAIKYSPKDCAIDIEFDEYKEGLEITITNTGPYLSDEEEEKIFTKGYRGQEAIKTGLPGQGFGMSFIKHICTLHNADAKVESDDNYFVLNGIKYSSFSVKINFYK